MKKLTRFSAAFVAVCALALGFTLAGCADANDGGLDLGNGTGTYIAKNTGTEIVFVGSTEVLKEHEEYSLLDYMTALDRKNQIAFDGYVGDYGYFITSVNGISSTQTSFWSVYISFKTLEGDDAIYAGGEYSTEYAYGETILYSANYGVSGIPYVSGATYALVLESWSM